MPLDFDNSNQSKNRINFIKIIGLKPVNPKISPVNLYRQYGAYSAVYYNGNSAGSEVTGIGGSNDNPGGLSGDPTKPDYPVNPPAEPQECQYTNIDDIGNVAKGSKMCGLKGFDCQTGEEKRLNFNPPADPNNPCDCNPPPYGTYKIMSYGLDRTSWCTAPVYTGRECVDYAGFVAKFNEIKEQVTGKGEVCRAVPSDWENSNIGDEAEWLSNTSTIFFQGYIIVRTQNGYYGGRITVQGSDDCSHTMPPKDKAKQYIKDGIIYTCCDDDEQGTQCTTMCDSLSNVYVICVNDDGDIDITSNDGFKKTIGKDGEVL